MRSRPDPVSAERALALHYAPSSARPGVMAVFALDEKLSGLIRAGRDPLMAQMRLAWWRDALIALDSAALPPEPVLRALALHALPAGVAAQALGAMVDGWEILLAPDRLGEREIADYAAARGAELFRAAALILGEPQHPAVCDAGEGWALTDLAGHESDRGSSARIEAIARGRLAAAMRRRWPWRLRSLGALALGARMDLAGIAPGTRRRALRLMAHLATGR